MTDRELMQQALEAMEDHANQYPHMQKGYTVDAITALKAALAESVEQPQCNPHPKAPHGFLRNASHNEGRYVCECEGWEPYEAGYQAGMEAALAEPPTNQCGETCERATLCAVCACGLEESKEEPVAWIYEFYADPGHKGLAFEPQSSAHNTPLYAQPPQRLPVAWRTFDGEGNYDYRDYENNEDYDQQWNRRNPRHRGWVQALYLGEEQ